MHVVIIIDLTQIKEKKGRRCMNLIIIFNYLALPIIVDALYKITCKHLY
jgi:hypothetical protein